MVCLFKYKTFGTIWSQDSLFLLISLLFLLAVGANVVSQSLLQHLSEGSIIMSEKSMINVKKA